MPSIWLGIASLGLVVVSVLLYLHGRTTGIGILIVLHGWWLYVRLEAEQKSLPTG